MNAPNKNLVLGLMTLAILGALLCFSKVAAQSEGLQPIYTGSSHSHPLNIQWSSDSQRLVFQDTYDQIGTTVTNNSWNSYNPDTGILVKSNVWPLQPEFTAPERALMKELPNSFTILSPSGNYLLLPCVIPFDFDSLCISNRSGIQRLSDDLILSSQPDSFRAFWSDDGSSVVVVKDSLTTLQVTEHLSNYSIRLADAIIHNVFTLEFGEHEYIPQDAQDISNDGETVLLRAYDGRDIAKLNDPFYQLILWHPNDPTQTQVIDDLEGGKIIGASFKDGDENTILLVNETGLLEYDVVSGQTTILRTDINANLSDHFAWAIVMRAIFSPNDEWLALVVENKLYVYKLGEGM